MEFTNVFSNTIEIQKEIDRIIERIRDIHVGKSGIFCVYLKGVTYERIQTAH